MTVGKSITCARRLDHDCAAELLVISHGGRGFP